MKKIEPTCSTCHYWKPNGSSYELGEQMKTGGMCTAIKESFFIWADAIICDNRYKESTETFIERKNW